MHYIIIWKQRQDVWLPNAFENVFKSRSKTQNAATASNTISKDFFKVDEKIVRQSSEWSGGKQANGNAFSWLIGIRILTMIYLLWKADCFHYLHITMARQFYSCGAKGRKSNWRGSKDFLIFCFQKEFF